MSGSPSGAAADAARINVHGVCVAIAGQAALLRGRSGSLKSDLALRFLAQYGMQGAVLIADDQVLLSRHGDAVLARCPPAIAGRIEVRGIGIVDAPAAGEARLVLLVDLVPSRDVPRLPPDPPPRESILDVGLPLLRLDPREASAPVKLKLAMTGVL